MSNSSANPFNITKAVDFSDREINELWVDLPGGPGFWDIAKPTSPVPMLILGGKGSGKTHLLRYFSYPLQKLRHEGAPSALCDDGYIGIYLRGGGLNSARFSGKGQEADTWSSIFGYYFELWLAQLVLEAAHDAFKLTCSRDVQVEIVAAIAALFDTTVTWEAESIAGVIATLRSWQRSLDIAINNCAISRTLDVQIRASPARLAFGIPRALRAFIPVLQNVQFLYLIDELENFSADQQKYINTLIREREDPCSIRVGAKLYGIRTYETYSAGEINREGSEFERILLDDHLRQNKNYPAFAKNLCLRRLSDAGYLRVDGLSADTSTSGQLSLLFETPKRSPFLSEEALSAVERFEPAERPYLTKLRSRLREGARPRNNQGLGADESMVNLIVDRLSFPAHPLLEKANILLFYKDWSAGRNLTESAALISLDASNSVLAGKPLGRLKAVFSHFQTDLLAQLYAEIGEKPPYLGFDAFVDMSRGIPRNLLVVLKHVFQWSTFNGESPFRGQPISRRSQTQGVLEAAQWFTRDAEVLGAEGAHVQRSIRRLAELFRELRFSDKPAECSLSTFSADVSSVSATSRYILETAEKWSLLIRIPGGQRDRNSQRVDSKFQINSMLAPLWDLPISRRGAIALSTAEVNAIFDPAFAEGYENVKRQRVSRMMAPHFVRAASVPIMPLPLFDQ